MNLVADFFRKYGAIRMNKARERLMRFTLAELETIREETQAQIESDSLCGADYADAVIHLQDLDAVIGFMRQSQEAHVQAAREKEMRQAIDEETTRRASVFVEEIRKLGPAIVEETIWRLRMTYCREEADRIVRAKSLAMLETA